MAIELIGQGELPPVIDPAPNADNETFGDDPFSRARRHNARFAVELAAAIAQASAANEGKAKP